jgi:GPH family glycoside/pentoside/hexuronide:cation symporter
MTFREGFQAVIRHESYRTLATFYLLGRMAVDLVGAMLLYYMSYTVGRPEDWQITMFLFLSVVILALPVWRWVAQRLDKRRTFAVGATWWMLAQLLMLAGGPQWPREVIFAVAAFAAVGYAVADLMPWAMLPDVIDEDELLTGWRREGLYNGFFTFLRKIGGATAILLSGIALKLAGYDGSLETQPASAVMTIRLLMALVPAALLGASVWVARRYALDRDAHAEIMRRLADRRRPAEGSPPGGGPFASS